MSARPTTGWVPGYGTNGFTEHTLDQMLDVIEAEGYGAIALTLGPAHFDPFADDWRERAEALATELDRRGLRVVVETGAPYLLDAFRPFRPSLADRDASARLALLERGLDIAKILGADCMSLWSGALAEGMTADEGWRLLVERLAPVLEKAARLGVRVAIEPEPGMIVETVPQALRWRELVGSPDHLGITVDLGHAIAVDEPGGVAGAIRAAGELIFNVQVDDMPAGHHDHRALGDGDLDLQAAFDALAEVGYTGVAALELPRHAGEAPAQARESLRIMTELAQGGGGWEREARRAVRDEPERAAELFADAARQVGRGSAAERARAAIVGELVGTAGGSDIARRLYDRGDVDERIAVIRALDALADSCDDLWRRTGVEIVSDALRTNDPRLVGAAMGSFAERHLDDAPWRQGVLKLVFMEAPLAQVAGLDARRDDELAAMAERFAAERRAAGRPVPDDLALLIAGAPAR